MTNRNTDSYLRSVIHTKALKRRVRTVLPAVSLLVIILICWWLKLTGITMAGEAFCGMDEHVHNDQCTVRTLICTEEGLFPDEAAPDESPDAPEEEPVQDEPVPDESIQDEPDGLPADDPAEIPSEEPILDGLIQDDPDALLADDPAEIPSEEPISDDLIQDDPDALPADDFTEIPAEDSVFQVLLPEETPLSETPVFADMEPPVSTEPPVHIHSDACYEITYTCEMEEHVHLPSCYSDITADIETAADWEATLPELTPEAYADNIVAVATSQLGYTESELNFQVDAEGIRRGYTRYGEWYGSPYGDWSTMFTSFCLRYAGISDLPVSSGADALRIQWEGGQRYITADRYKPIPGDVVFLDKNGNGTPEATGIVTLAAKTEITVIEGDLNNQVVQTVYSLSDWQITGYGLTTPDSLLALAAAERSTTVLADLILYDAANPDNLTGGKSFILYTEGIDGSHYAIDGTGNAVQIYVDDFGRVTSDTENPDDLFWTFTRSGSYNNQPVFQIRNQSSGTYLYPSSNTSILQTTSRNTTSALYANGSGVQIRGNQQNYYAYLSEDYIFTRIGSLEDASTFYLAQAPTRYTVWLDGTCGGSRSLNGSLEQDFQVAESGTFTLPAEWQSPSNYSYKVRGWYDVKNAQYYLPGETITVTEHLVFYPDWVAETYDIGHFTAQTTDTVSTDAHITTRVYDYNFLFNVHSTNVSVTADGSDHSESWSLVQTGGTVPFQNRTTLDFLMTDNETGGEISRPNNLNNTNTWTGNSNPRTGLYRADRVEALFGTDNDYDPATGTGILGKTYLGTGDHLFQFGSDPGSEYYGYYYFDSSLNAASYNQTDQRFYVYDYLQATSDSGTSDFLPLNSPNANTNGSTVETYSGNGTTNYEFDNFQSANSADANLWFGMTMETRFYLSDDPGTRDASGEYSNRDVYGNEMHFRFSGDDDVWVLVDGEVVLDLGGIHSSSSGEINFSTGEVTVNGGQPTPLPDSIKAGEHVMTVLYLERGGGQSNSVIYFNLAPRYSLTLQKEDVLTQEVLNGAQFTVYEDLSCTEPAKLWTSEESYNNNDPATSVFTVENGKTHIWGLGAGKTYYIRETRPPNNSEYEDSLVNGIISLTLDKGGNASYNVEIIMGTDQNGNLVTTTPGFTVHGYRIDEETQQAYIVATNAKKWVQEVTSIQAVKVWNDNEDHSNDSVTVYLTVKNPEDGSVSRIREVELSEANGWTWSWDNMPKYWNDTDKTKPVEYGVEEAYISGYTPTIEKVDKVEITTTSWEPVTTIENGKTYLLKTDDGFLSTTSANSSSNNLKWETNQDTAENSSLALWKATLSGSNVQFVNGASQKLTYNNGNRDSNRYFYATSSNSSGNQTFTPEKSGNRFRFYITKSRTKYYMSDLNSSNRLSITTSSGNGLLFTPYALVETTTETELNGFGFKITNTPLENETSVTVHKVWDPGQSTSLNYQQSQVTVKLLADGKDTGRTVTLTLKNGWTASFSGLPYTNNDGSIIQYTVVETWTSKEWSPSYGEIITMDSGGQNANPTYETTITNIYHHPGGPILPTTGGFGPTPWVLCGFTMMAGSLICGYILRRKRERRYQTE